MAIAPSPGLAGFADPTDGLSESLSSLLSQLEASHEAELTAEAQLNAIREGNARRLAKLTRAQQEEYFKEERNAYTRRVEEEKKLHDQRVKDIEKEIAENAGLSDKEFKEKTGKTRKQKQKELAEAKKQQENDLKRQLNAEKQIKKTKTAIAKELNEEQKKAAKEALTDGTKSFKERLEVIKGLGKDADGKFNAGRMMLNLGQSLKDALSDFAKQLDTSIDEIGKYKSSIDTRLQGLNADTKFGSY